MKDIKVFGFFLKGGILLLAHGTSCGQQESVVPPLKSVQSWSKSAKGHAVSPALLDVGLRTSVTDSVLCTTSNAEQINVFHFGTDTCLTPLRHPQCGN